MRSTSSRLHASSSSSSASGNNDGARNSSRNQTSSSQHPSSSSSSSSESSSSTRITTNHASSSSFPTHNLVPGPDDSDILDEEDEEEDEDAFFQSSSQSQHQHQHQHQQDEDQSDEMDLLSSQHSNLNSIPLPCHPLITIGNTLYFTFFKDHLPDPNLLNQNHGRASVILPTPTQSSNNQQFNQQQLNSALREEIQSSEWNWLTIDEELVYMSFFDDWGPLNVGMFYRFCLYFHGILNKRDSHPNRKFILYTSNNPRHKANAALIAALYAMIVDRISPADAFHPLSEIEFQPFRDAGYGRADFSLTIQDILYGISKSISLNLLDLSKFNLEEYEFYETVQNGDWNWISPDFLAFASPNDREFVNDLKNGKIKLDENGLVLNINKDRERLSGMSRNVPKLIKKTLDYFSKNKVKLVVRLNNPLYDKKVFQDHGIEHLDMYFDDGSNPSDEIIKSFIQKSDSVIKSGGKIAVHCKAGLGRTGVLIGAYLIWKFNFTSNEVIGFMRFMRPGCVVGPQQHFMYQNFMDWIRWNQEDKLKEEMKKEIEKERIELKRKLLKELEKERKDEIIYSSNNNNKNSLKRPSDSDEIQSNDDGVEKKKGKSKSLDDVDDEEEGKSNGPSTPPPAKRFAHSTPKTSIPTHKPTPCVGQPRKSPSPERKRPAGSNRHPSTVARMQYHTSNLNTENFGRSLSARFSNESDGESNLNTENQNGKNFENFNSATVTNHCNDVASKVLSSSKTNVLLDNERNSNNSSTNSNDTDNHHDSNTISKIKSINNDSTSNSNSTPTPTVYGQTSRTRGLGHERTKSEITPTHHLIKKDDVFDPENSLNNLTPRGGNGLPPLRASPDIKSKYGLKDATSSVGSNNGAPNANPSSSGLKNSGSSDSNFSSSSTNQLNSITSLRNSDELKVMNEGTTIDKDAEALGIVEFSNVNKNQDSSFDSIDSEKKVEGKQKLKEDVNLDDTRKDEEEKKSKTQETLIQRPVKSSSNVPTKRLPATSSINHTNKSSISDERKSKLNSSQTSSRSSSNSSSDGKRSTSNSMKNSSSSSRPAATITTSSTMLKRRPISSTTNSGTSKQPDSNSLLRDARAGLTKSSTSSSSSNRIEATQQSSKNRVGIPPHSSSNVMKSSSIGLAASVRARPNQNQNQQISSLNSIPERPDSPSRGVGRGAGNPITGNRIPNQSIKNASSNPSRNASSSTTTTFTTTNSKTNSLKRSRIETPELKNNGFETSTSTNFSRIGSNSLSSSSNNGSRSTSIPPAGMGMGLNIINGLNGSSKTHNLGRNVRRRRSSAGDIDVPV